MGTSPSKTIKIFKCKILNLSNPSRELNPQNKKKKKKNVCVCVCVVWKPKKHMALKMSVDVLLVKHLRYFAWEPHMTRKCVMGYRSTYGSQNNEWVNKNRYIERLLNWFILNFFNIKTQVLINLHSQIFEHYKNFSINLFKILSSFT